MFRLVSSLLLAVSLVLTAGTGTAYAYVPDAGAMFNNPAGDSDAKNRSMNHIKRAVERTPSGGRIQFAAYSHNKRSINDALLDACARGVTVQMVTNNNWISNATLKLQERLGTGVDYDYAADSCPAVTDGSVPADQRIERPGDSASFAKICRQACRVAGNGNQHIKLFMFSRSGDARNVIMTGSTNTATFAANTHWNDLFTLNNASQQMWDDYSGIFHELARGQESSNPYRMFRHGDLVTEFGARVAARDDRSLDPILQRLNKVSCRTGGGYGINGRTAVRVMMYAWVGERGLYLANKVASLRRSGCNVKAILSQPSKGVKQALRAGGVGIRSADLNLDDNANTGFNGTAWERFTHQKWMTVNGTWAGDRQRVVWTSSENWSNNSFNNDEMTLKIPRSAAQRAYARHFDHLWGSKQTRAY